MKYIKFAALFIISMCLFCGCKKNDNLAFQVTSGKIVSAVSKADFKKNYAEFHKNYEAEVSHNRREKTSEIKLKQEFANNSISDILINSAIQNNKITVSEAEIKDKENKLIKFYGSKEEYEKMLQNQGLDKTTINEIFKYEIQLDKLFEMTGKNKVSQREIEQFYKKNKTVFNQPERIRVFQIVIKNNSENLINDLVKKLELNPYNFPKLAQTYSQDKKTAKLGGDLGFISYDFFPKEISKELFSQKVGTVSKPLKNSNITYLFYVTDKAAKVSYPLEKVENDIKVFIYNQKRKEALDVLAQNLKNNATIVYYDKTLHPDYPETKGVLSKLFDLFN